MKPIVKDILKAVLVLAGIALISGLLLGFVYPATRLSEEELIARAKKPLPDIYAAEDYELIRYESASVPVDYFFQVKGEETYIILATGSGGYGGDVQMYVVVKENQIIRLSKGTAGETPGVSDKAFSNAYYSQFYGKDITKVGKFTFDGGVDAATGATRSSTAILNAVNKAVVFFTEFSIGGI